MHTHHFIISKLTRNHYYPFQSASNIVLNDTYLS